LAYYANAIFIASVIIYAFQIGYLQRPNIKLTALQRLFIKG